MAQGGNKNPFHIDVRGKVMERIKKENIGMRSPGFFLRQRMGLEILLSLGIAAAGILLVMVFDFFRKIEMAEGIKNFITYLPYGHMILFLFLILFFDYIIKKINYLPGRRISFKTPIILIFFVIIFFSALTIGSGDNFPNCWHKIVQK